MRKQITAATIRDYANFTGDQAPIHLLDEAAVHAGYPAPIVHGMYLMGLAQSIYLAENGTHWVKSYSMTFQKPLVQGATACFDYEVRKGEIQVTITTEDEEREVIAKGVFTVMEGDCSA